MFSPVYSNGQTELILQVWSLKLKIDFSWFFSKRVPHVKIETFKSNNSETDRPIQIKLEPVTHFSKLSKILKFGVEIRKKKIWSFLTGFSSKKSKLSFYAKKVCFQAKVALPISNILAWSLYDQAFKSYGDFNNILLEKIRRLISQIPLSSCFC